MSIQSHTLKRGFSLLELVIAVGIAVAIGVTALQGLHGALTLMNQARNTEQQATSLDELSNRLEREAASSDAVWVTQDGSGNTLHFSFLDGSGNTRHRMYRFATQLQQIDAATNTVTAVDEAQGLTGFTATSMRASEIANATNALAGFFTQIPAAPDTQYTIDANGFAGNVVCVVTLQARLETRVVHLIAGPSAESFGVEQGVFRHSIVWRQTNTRRFLFGFGQKTNYDIWAEVSYTTDNWTTSHVWCSYDIYGPLDVSDPRAQPTYDDASESAHAIFAACQKRTGQNAVPAATPNPNVRDIE